MSDRGQALVQALADGVVRRRWSCHSDKLKSGAHFWNCTPEDNDQRGYLHSSCRWYWDLWTIEQTEIEVIYQKALDRSCGVPHNLGLEAREVEPQPCGRMAVFRVRVQVAGSMEDDLGEILCCADHAGVAMMWESEESEESRFWVVEVLS